MSKIKGIKGLVIGVVAISLLLVGSAAYAADQMSFISKEFSNISETEAMSKLSESSFDALLSDINAMGDNVDMSDLIFHANALSEKAAVEVSQERIIKEIANEYNSDAARVILTQIYRRMGNDGNNTELVAMLERGDVDFEIKRNILLNLYQSPTANADVFVKVALGEDNRLAFHAIKILNEVDSKAAIEIADGIIKGFDGDVTEKVCAAIKVKATQLRGSSDKGEILEFISFCDDILAKEYKKDDIVTDTVIFALSDIMSVDAISYIVMSEKIDNIAKSYCINQNYSVLEKMLTGDATKTDVEIVSEAMRIYPIADMVSPLQSVLSSQLESRSDESDETTKQIQSIIEFVSENGLKATGKY